MDIFKFSRGHFFGTLLPGSFLLINIIFIDPSVLGLLSFHNSIVLKDNQTSIIIVGFVISYVVGIFLRLLSPDVLERIAVVVRIPIEFFRYLYYCVFKKKSETMSFKQKIGVVFQNYPYLNWYFDNYIKNYSTTQHKKFYNKEFKKDITKLKGNFINSCKTFIYDYSSGITEEIMYTEGLIRFICGIIYSLLFILILLGFHYSDMKEIFYFYLILLLVFLSRLRGIRVKEVLIILDGYMFLKTKKN